IISGTACSGGNSHRMHAAIAENAKPESPLTTPATNSTTATTAASAGLMPPPRFARNATASCGSARELSARSRDVMAIPPTAKVAIGTTILAIGVWLIAIPGIFSPPWRRGRVLWRREVTELAVEDFEKLLIYPVGELVFSLKLNFLKELWLTPQSVGGFRVRRSCAANSSPLPNKGPT